MAYDGYQCLKIRIERGVAWVTIDHPPINLFDLALMQDLMRFGAEVEADDAVKVVVLQSADPEFFIAHADVNLIQAAADRAAAENDGAQPFPPHGRPISHDAEGDDREDRRAMPRWWQRAGIVVRHTLRGARAGDPGAAGSVDRYHSRRQRNTAAAATDGTQPGARSDSGVR